MIQLCCVVWYSLLIYYVFSSCPKFGIYFFDFRQHWFWMVSSVCCWFLKRKWMGSPSQGTRSIPLCMGDHATLIEATGEGIGWMDWTTAICCWCYWYQLMAHTGLSTARTNQTKSNQADRWSKTKIVSVQSCGRSIFVYQRLQAAFLAYSLMCSLGTFLDGNPRLSKFEQNMFESDCFFPTSPQ